MKRALALLGGTVVRDGSGWRTARFDERDGHGGVMGDFLRVHAVACLWRQGMGSICIVSGGRVVPGAPTVAWVNRGELVRAGVPEGCLLLEEASLNTWQQLQAVKRIIAEQGIEAVTLVSNAWHLPRIREMLLRDEALSGWQARGAVACVGAEEVLIEQDPKLWGPLVGAWRATPEFRARVALEERGIADLRVGTYRLI